MNKLSITRITLVQLDFDVVERMAEEHGCTQSPEDLFLELEAMLEDEESSIHIPNYLRDLQS